MGTETEEENDAERLTVKTANRCPVKIGWLVPSTTVTSLIETVAVCANAGPATARSRRTKTRAAIRGRRMENGGTETDCNPSGLKPEGQCAADDSRHISMFGSEFPFSPAASRSCGRRGGGCGCER